jgi:hypothetical protein
LYLPALQAVQLVPSAPVYPLLHLQSVIWSKPPPLTLVDSKGHCRQTPGPATSLYEPSWHAAQSVEPGAVLNVPAAQGEHSKPSGLEYPELQKQSVDALLPGSEKESAAHAIQKEEESAATCPEKVPAEQGRHASVPVEFLYVPGMHAEQGEIPPGPS